MGIQGMHQHVRPYTAPVHLSALAGRRVGCDGFAWLHRGAVACAQELHTQPVGQRWWEQQHRPPPYITFCLRRVRMMLAEGITPVVVLDGGRLPAKEATQTERRKRKAKMLEKGRRLLAAGNQAAADAVFAQTLDVTPEMAHELVRALAQHGVEYVIAPYEADPQLAFLSRLGEDEGGVAAVVTEDSDLIVYGCQRIIFKLDSHGMGQDFRLASLTGPPPEALADDVARGAVLSFRSFDLGMLRTLGVLAGCDFLPSVPGMGFKRAHALVKKYRVLNRVLTIMKYEKGLKMAPEYPEAAQRAYQGFCHPVVFHPWAPGGGAATRLEPLPSCLEADTCDTSFLGAMLSDELARGIASGRVHPCPPHRAMPPVPPPPAQRALPAARPPPCLPAPATWMQHASTGGRRLGVSPRRHPGGARSPALLGRPPSGAGLSPSQRARSAVAAALKAVRTPPRTPRSSKRARLAPHEAAQATTIATPGRLVSSCESIPEDTPEARRLEFGSAPRPAVARLVMPAEGASREPPAPVGPAVGCAGVPAGQPLPEEVPDAPAGTAEEANGLAAPPFEVCMAAPACSEAPPVASKPPSAPPRPAQGSRRARAAPSAPPPDQRRISSFFGLLSAGVAKKDTEERGTVARTTGGGRSVEHVSVLAQLVAGRVSNIAERWHSQPHTNAAPGVNAERPTAVPTNKKRKCGAVLFRRGSQS